MEEPDPTDIVLPIHAESVSVDKRVRTTVVRVARTTTTRDERVEIDRAFETVSVTHVPIGRVVDAVPPIREDGDTTIIPIIEEVVVVERRLVLKEELHVRRERGTARHVETVALREQVAAVTRHPVEPASTATIRPEKEPIMSNERIVALFDTPAHADLAMQDLLAAGLPESAIERHAAARDDVSRTGVDEPRREPGFWARLFGGEPEHHADFYDRSLDSGATIVTVLPPVDRVSDIVTILESHHPVDMDERAESYGYGSGRVDTATGAGSTAYDPAYGVAARPGMSTAAPLGEPAVTGGVVPEAGGLGVTGTAPYAATGPAPTGMSGAVARDDLGRGTGETLSLSAEEVTIGKRLVNRGSTRIRRYVVETPVSEEVSLHDERVAVDRRPVEAGRPVADGAFTDRTIEMTETAEEAVVGKTARVVEEVVLRREGVDHVETVHDTVRHEEIAVERTDGTGPATTTDAAAPARSPKI